MKINKNKVILATATVTAISTIAFQATTIANNNAEIKGLIEERENMTKEIEDINNNLKEKLEKIDNMIEIENSLKKEVENLKEDNDKLRKELANTVDLELTYYTTLPQENGGYTTTAIQTKLRHGVIASNYYPIGTKILINGTVYTVEDRGSSNFDGPNRLDVLVERQYGESDSQYLKRVNDMGRKKVKGRIIR